MTWFVLIFHTFRAKCVQYKTPIAIVVLLNLLAITWLSNDWENEELAYINLFAEQIKKKLMITLLPLGQSEWSDLSVWL